MAIGFRCVLVAAALVALAGACSGKRPLGEETVPPSGPVPVDASQASAPPDAPSEVQAEFSELTALLDRDVSLPMRGKGWYCYTLDMVSLQGMVATSGCSREKDSCLQYRANPANREPGDTISECEYRDRAFCARARLREKGVDFSICTITRAHCERNVESIRKSTDTYEFSTNCEELR